MTGERKILTLKRKSHPENQEKASETPVRWSRKKIVIEAVPNTRKKKNLSVPVIKTVVPPPTPPNMKCQSFASENQNPSSHRDKSAHYRMMKRSVSCSVIGLAFLMVSNHAC